MGAFEFKDPVYLFLLIPFFIGIVVYYLLKINKRESSVSVSSVKIVKGRRSWRALTYPYLNILRILTIFILIIALARPGRGVKSTSIKNLGIDIMIVLDVSGSMRSVDFQPENRLNVAKKVLRAFIHRRKGDKIGLVVFGGEAYLQCPPTVEKDMIDDIVNELDFDSVSEDGTAIGDALALAASRMSESKAESKVILLLTDGESNRGSIEPETAAKACASMGIKVYTVGIGKEAEEIRKMSMQYRMKNLFSFKKGPILFPYNGKTIKKIPEITGGKFYRATSSGLLWENIKDIDRLEKSEYDVKVYHQFFDRFDRYLLLAICLFFIEIILRALVYRKIP